MSWSNDRTNFDRNIAVIIGINDYQNGIHPLSTPVNDATELANLLKTEYKYQEMVYLFPPYKEATLENISELLKETLPNQIRPTSGDRLLFYFAGHGIARNSEDGPAGYLIPQNAQLGKLETFLPMRDLNAALSQLDCHHLLVILDCCFAGNFRWSSARNVIPVPETIHREHYDRFIRCSAWQAITSAAHNQEALDFLSDLRDTVKNSHHSPFALALIEGLKDNKADLTGDGVITAPELYLYLRDRLIGKDGVSELQTPGLWPLPKHDRGEFIFTLPGFKREQLTPAPPLNQDNNPYRGLQPFDEKHARFFFGRQELVEKLYKRISQSEQSSGQFIVVVGISGSGKSSLVKAGLIPYLRKSTNSFPENLVYASILTLAIFQEFPLYPLKFLPIHYVYQWQILEPMRPGESPFAALARTILAIANETFTAQLEQINFLNTALQEKAEQFDKLAPIWNDASLDQKLLLLIDRFEELKTACRNSDEERQLEKFKNTFQDYLKNLIASLQTEPQELINIITTWSQTHPNVKVLLIIDQFEELITFSHNRKEDNNQEDKKEWQQFLKMLAQTLKSCPHLCLVLTLRSDFETRFIGSDLNAYWAKARFPVRPMRTDELRQAIVGPASEMALYFEPPNLVDRLIDEIGQMPGALPLLSFTLSELYIKLYKAWQEEGKQDRTLTIDVEFERQGGFVGSLASRANQEYNILEDEKLQTTMRRVMLRMLTVEGWEVARRQVPDLELEYPVEEENKRVQEVIKRLLNARLVVKAQGIEDGYVEPAHDYLVRGWDKLQDWIKEDREDLILQQRLIPAANDWVKNGKLEDNYLLPDDERLNQLEKICNQENNWLNKREICFIQASVKRRDRIRAEKQLLEQQVEKDRQIEFARNLAATSESIGDQYPHLYEISALLAAESMKRFQEIKEVSPEADRALRNSLTMLPKSIAYIQHKGEVYEVTFSPDGKYLATRSRDESTRIIQVDNGKEIAFIQQVEEVTFSPNSQYLATCSTRDKTAWLIQVDTGKEIASMEYQRGVYDVVFSPNNQYLATSSYDGSTQLIKVGTGETIASMKHQSPPDEEMYAILGKEKVATFSPNSQYLVTGSAWDQTVRLIQTNSGKEIISIQLQGEVKDAVFSSDSQYLATYGCSDNTVYLIQVSSGQVTSIQLQVKVEDVVFSPNGKYLATRSRSSNTAPLIQVGTGQEIASIQHQERVVEIGPSPSYLRSVDEIVFSPNSQYLATYSYSDNTVHLIQVNSGQEITSIQFQGEVVFSPNSQYLAISNWAHTARLFKTSSGQEITPIQLQVEVEDIATMHPDRTHLYRDKAATFSPDSKYLISHSIRYGTAHLLEVSTGNEIRDFQHQTVEDPVTFSPDSKYLATGNGWNNTAHLIQVNTGQEITTIQHEGKINKLVFSPDSKYLATGAEGRTACIIELGTGKQIAIIPHQSWVTAIAFSPDSKYLATASFDNTARIIQVVIDKKNATIQHQMPIDTLAFSPDGKYLATGSRDNTVRITEVGSGKQIATIQLQNWVNTLTFSPDSKYLGIGSKDINSRIFCNETTLIQVATGNKVTTLPNLDHVNTFAFSPNGKYLVTGSIDNTVCITDINTGQQIASIQYQDDVNVMDQIRQFPYWRGVLTMAFSPDGEYVATGSNDKTIRIIEVVTGKEIKFIQQPHKVITVTYSPDGKYLAIKLDSLEENPFRIIEIDTGKEIATIQHQGGVETIAFSPDDQYLATGSSRDNIARISEVRTGQEIATIQHRGGVNILAFSPDGQYLATGSSDNTARISKVRTGQEVATIQHQSHVTTLAFSPDGKYLATGSWDNTARLLQVSIGKVVATFQHQQPVLTLAFSPNSQYVATGGLDNTAQLQFLDSQSLISEVCNHLKRNLTINEWNDYIKEPLDKYKKTCSEYPIEPILYSKNIEENTIKE